MIDRNYRKPHNIDYMPSANVIKSIFSSVVTPWVVPSDKAWILIGPIQPIYAKLFGDNRPEIITFMDVYRISEESISFLIGVIYN